MSTSIMTNERLVELLVQRATEGLNASEKAELNRLLGEERYTDAEHIDAAAAALMLAGLDDEPLPTSLRETLERQADDFSQMPAVAPTTLLQPKAASDRQPTRVFGSGLGWLAAAACAALAVAGWWPRIEEERGDIDVFTAASADLETLEKARERLLAQGSVLQREWKGTEDAAARGVTGDIIWDEQAQVGYMRFRGLPMNDPQELQYQLWIFDATRGDQHPVDGGVFNIPASSSGEVVVPILAKLPVRKPALFAVTIEKPGGVVVSSRERIVVLAPVSAG